MSQGPSLPSKIGKFPVTGLWVNPMHASALFFDRDGVINVDLGYIHRSDQFEFVPGIFELARFWTNELRQQGSLMLIDLMLELGVGVVRSSRQVAFCTRLTVLNDRFYRTAITICPAARLKNAAARLGPRS